MAIIGLTESDLQDAIHTLYENDADTPVSTDDDYIIRRRLMNVAINRWENNMGTLWNELWTDTALTPGSAELTAVTGQSEYDAPTGFMFPANYIYIYDGTLQHKRYKVIKPEERGRYNDNSEYAYFSGNTADGIKLVLNPAANADMNGMTIKYAYYKRAEALGDPADTPEMSDPYYIVHSVVAELHRADNNLALYQASLAEAEERLKQMVVKNTMYANYQDHGLEDNQFINNGSAFGE